jgi:hypothetical protein
MARRNLVLGALIVALVVIGLGGWYVSSQPSRVERIVACFQKLGYSTSVVHDDGIAQATYPEGTTVLDDGTYQARPPGNFVTALLPGGVAAIVGVPDSGDTSSTRYNGVPSASLRASVADCAG